jgi:hypothetical protein
MAKKTKFNVMRKKKKLTDTMLVDTGSGAGWKNSPCNGQNDGQNSQLVHWWVLVHSSRLNKYFALVFLWVVVELTFKIIMIIKATLVLFWKIQCLPKTESANDQEATYSSIKNYIRRRLGISEGSPVASQEQNQGCVTLRPRHLH